ncbi:Defective in cullin neddylation protein 1 [Leucoagaricus sp. SymC.cos]|nr:Defective in cullin neddylation protein 1 [Leucoagaricus sp. SymC.cos]
MPGKSEDASIAQFIAITGASDADARRFLKKYKRLEIAMDAYYNDPSSASSSSLSNSNAPSASPTLIAKLFDNYKDEDGDEITVDGTLKLCGDFGVDPEDVVMLAVAYELKSPRMGTWTRKGWMEGWKELRCDKLESMKQVLPRLRGQLSSDPEYFRKVYYHTFEFARNEGQRSLALETAKALWALLLPHGLKGGALSYLSSTDTNDDVAMDGVGSTVGQGWSEQRTETWFRFLDEKHLKGISRDTWQMFLEFVRTIDSRYTNYDPEGKFYPGQISFPFV